MHPILDSLKGTPHEWLSGLLQAFNAGSIGKFESHIPYFPREVRGCSRPTAILANGR
jgi:26S proteasome regulatory subunit N9